MGGQSVASARERKMKMEIKVTHPANAAGFVRVEIIEFGTTINLGLLDDIKRDKLAMRLIDAAYAMGPRYNEPCMDWFADMIKRCGIELPKEGEG